MKPTSTQQDTGLTLDELCAATGESRRTVRFYILNGLLAGPSGAGPAARYPAEHVQRLKVVRALQAEGMQLSKIRDLVAAAGEGELDTVLRRDSEPPRQVATPQTELSSSGLSRTQWERIVLEPGVELHVCRPLSVGANRRVQRLMDFVRQQSKP